MHRVDLNCDMGESFGAYTLGLDEEAMAYVSSANVACGFHASDPRVMEKTVALAAARGVAVGAHPGFPDLAGFGRRNMDIAPAEVRALVSYQIGALYAFCRASGVPLVHVKPHGALYNMAAADAKLARAVCEAVASFDSKLILLALSGSRMLDAAAELGVPAAAEVFADRAYEEDGTLVGRSKPGALIEDEELAVSRLVRMVKEGVVRAISGRDIALRVQSVCVHGDGPKAVAFLSRIRAAFDAEGIAVQPLSKLVL